MWGICKDRYQPLNQEQPRKTSCYPHSMRSQTDDRRSWHRDWRLKPVAFEGGPLTFHPTLVKVFAERLNLKEDEILCPKHSELMIAYGGSIIFG